MSGTTISMFKVIFLNFDFKLQNNKKVEKTKSLKKQNASVIMQIIGKSTIGIRAFEITIDVLY